MNPLPLARLRLFLIGDPSPSGLVMGFKATPKDAAMTTLTALADQIDDAFDRMIDELEKILMTKVKELSKHYPTRTFRIASGHGGLVLEVSRRGKGWNMLTGRDTYFSVDCRGDGGTAPEGFAEDLFKEVDEISTRFQDHYNGYACLQVDYTVKNGELIEPAAA